MRSAIHSLARSSRAKNHRLRRFVARHLTLWLALLILGAVVLSSVLAGARSQGRDSVEGTEQKRGTRSTAEALNEKRGARLESNGNSDVRGAASERLASRLFMNPSAPSVGTTLTATSFAMLGARLNSDKGQDDPGGMQEGNFQSNGQTLQSRGEGDKASRKPKEERLTQANPEPPTIVAKPRPITVGPPVELQLKRAATRRLDLRTLPRTRPVQRERQELEPPDHTPVTIESVSLPPALSAPGLPAPAVQAPAPSLVFEGLDRENWGAGSPPDTNGDVGPTYYIQTVNTSVGIYRKSDGFREAAFTFDTLMSQGNFGNLCDTNNFGDPVVLYDTFEDRWILSDFAFLTDVSGNVLSPAYQCFAVSMNGNPLTGGWNFYSIQTADFLGDYPKLGIWPDGLYMSANMFTFGAGSTSQGVRTWAFNKAQMYAGSPTVKIVSFNLNSGDFTVVPANARLQTGTPPPGRPNLFLSTWLFTNAVTVYKFHVDWNSTSLSTFTGPDTPIAATSWPNAAVANAPQPTTATLLDVLQIRAMVQNQYTNFGGTESLWVSHTVRRANTTGSAAPRWYQVNVTGGTVAPNIPQAATWDPDGANLIHRFMPSLALDRAGNMAMGYTTSNSTTEFPSMKYAGRLSTDPVNTFSQTEQSLFAGTASQTGSTRWGDYSSMMLDPDGCTFWYTNQYANPASQTFDKRWLTKIASFKFTQCTPVGAGGTVSGTVTDSATTNPISGAIVALGSRTTTTNVSGLYTFSAIAAGTYPSITASAAGYGSSTATSIVVADAVTTTQDFSLTAAPTTTCLTDTTQADFLLGVFTGVDLNTSPGDVTLTNLAVDQQNTAGTTTGTGFGTPAWTGQTFTSAVNGQLVAADIQVFCNGCGATPPNLTLSVRNTTAGLPTGADLASVTIPGSAFSSGATVTFTASFGSPATLTSGTQYALILRPVSVPAGSGYFWIRSSPSTYASGSRVLSANSGGTWSTDTTRDFNFKTYMRGPYSPTSGNLVSHTRDANPAAGLTPIWSTFSWNATTPASTSLKFQFAGSNSVDGPFNFVGPDGTTATFFTTSPAPLGQFYGLRYLQYKAFLSTTDSAATPTLNDATICFANVDCSGTTPAITATPAQVCSNSTGNTASGPSGMTAYSWGITNGIITSSTNAQSVTYTAGASGNVTLTLTVTTPSGCISSNSALITINPIPATPTITPGGPTTFCAGGSVSLTSSTASGNQWYLNGNPIGGATNQIYMATAAGAYTTVVTTSGCAGSPSTATTVTVNPIPPTPTITPGGPTTFCTGGSVTLTSSSASGNQWFLNGNPIGGATNQAYVATAAGGYSIVVTDGNNCPSAPSASTTVTVNPIPSTPTITPGGATTFCQGGSVTLTSSSASGNQWFLNGNPIGGATNQGYIATAAGDYTNTVTTNGCTSSPSTATTVIVNPIPATPTITPGGPTTFCNGGSVTLTSSSASGNQWFLNGNPIGGATNQVYSATATGDYTNTITANGCTSSPSSATTVTVNPIPATPTITPGGPTTFCTGASVSLTSSSANGNQWYLNGNPIGGATNQVYSATAAGNYTNTVTTSGCTSSPSTATTVTVNPIPAAPTITAGGATTFCNGGSVTLTSSSSSGNQWYLNGNPIGGATNQGYIATASGDYTNTVTTSGCTSSPSTATTVTVNPIPAVPTITPAGATTFCASGSVPLTSSSASGNQWFLNGNPIGGATAQQYNAASSGDYTVTVTTSGCTSVPSAATAVTPNTAPTLIYPTPHNVAFGGSLSITPTAASDNGTVTYQVLAGHGLATAPTVDLSGGVSITNAQPAGAHTIAVRATDNCGAPTDASFTLQVQSPANVSGTKTVSGTFASGSSITYTVTLANTSTSPQLDNPGNEFTDVLPSNLVLVSANATSGAATAIVGTNTVSWSGSIAGNGSVTIAIVATINVVPDGTTVSNQGIISYDADGNGTNEASRLSDDPSTGGASDPTTFRVNDVNDPPDAVDDTLSSVAEDSGMRTISIASLLSNDNTGPANESGQTLTFSLLGGSGVGGTVSSDATKVYFTPAADFNGTASFQYTVTDNGTTNGAADPKSDTATVSFSVWEVNDAPIAVNEELADVVEDSEDRTIPFAVLTANDSKGPANESGQTLVVKTVSNAVGGTVSIVGGNVIFTPTADYYGGASFQYTVEDNGTTNGVADPRASAPAVARFTITEVNDAPTAVNDSLASVAEDSGPRTIPFSTLTANDSKGPANESGQSLVVKTVSNAVGGTVSIVGGNVVFAPAADFNGPAGFDYTIEDSGTTNGVVDPKTSGTATVSFNITPQADAPSVTNATTNANTQTTSGLVISRNPADGAEVTHFHVTGITGGMLFKNDGTTQINNGDFITFAEGNAGLKFTPGTSNESFTVQASLSASNTGLQGGIATATITVNPLGGAIRFTSANYSVAEGAGFITITVERNGDTSQAVTVDYASSDHSGVADFIPCTAAGVGFASSRCDFTTAIGTLRFAAGETTKTFDVLISQDNYVEGTETLELTLSNLTGGAVFEVPAAAILSITDDATEGAANPIDISSDFVRSQYHDFLHREPDGPGLAFWTDNIEKCNDPARRPPDQTRQTAAECIDKQRESTAIAFFMSPEFQITGGFVYRLYKGSLTGLPNYDGGSAGGSLGRFPTSLEFIRDVSTVSEGIVVNNQISGAVVEANRNRLAADFVQRPEFLAKYGGLDNTLYVQELFNTTGIAATAGEKQVLVNGLTNGTDTRAGVLRKVVDGTVIINNVQFTTTYGQAFYNQEFQRMFVFTEYLGYMRRNPDTAGFIHWLGKLNFYNGDPFQAELVRAFILSPEYRSRFGHP